MSYQPYDAAPPTGRPGPPILRTVLGARPGARSTTGPILRRLRGLVLLTTAATLATSLWAFTAVEHFARVVHTQAAPAVLQLSTARAAMLGAERIALDPASAEAAGAPGRFLSQISIASEALAQAAGSNAGSEDSGQLLRSVQGQILNYFTLVTRAWQEYRDGNRSLGGADQADAHVALHNGTGILPNLDTLIRDQQEAVDTLGRSGWLNGWATPLWLLPLVALGAVLLGAQLFLRRRLRRTLNPGLLLATTVLAVTAGYCGQRAAADHAGGRPGELLGLATASRPGSDQLAAVRGLLEPICPENCGRTLVVRSSPAPQGSARTTVPLPELSPEEVDELTAPPRGSVAVLIPLAALAVGGLAWVGFHGPVTEYRFQPR